MLSLAALHDGGVCPKDGKVRRRSLAGGGAALANLANLGEERAGDACHVHLGEPRDSSEVEAVWIGVAICEPAVGEVSPRRWERSEGQKVRRSEG